MKNFILLFALILAFSLPQYTHAEEPIFNRLMKLFTQVLGEKNTEIAVLKARIVEFEKNSNVKIVVQETPQICPVGAVNQNEINTLKMEYGLAISNIDEQIINLQKQITEAKNTVLLLGSGVTAYEVGISNDTERKNIAQINTLTNQKVALQIELKKKLINLGEY